MVDKPSSTLKVYYSSADRASSKCSILYLCPTPSQDRIKEVGKDEEQLLEEYHQVDERQLEEDKELFGPRELPEEVFDIGEGMQFGFGATSVSFGIPGNEITQADSEMGTPTLLHHEIESMEIDGWDNGFVGHEGLVFDVNEDSRVLAPATLATDTPMEIWLRSCDTPSASALARICSEQKKEMEERVELECLRNVYVEKICERPQAHAETLRGSGTAENSSSTETSIDPEVEVYYRNIKDRFPDIKHFLCLRLATANRARATSLREERTRNLRKAEERSQFVEGEIVRRNDDELRPHLESTDNSHEPEPSNKWGKGGKRKREMSEGVQTKSTTRWKPMNGARCYK